MGAVGLQKDSELQTSNESVSVGSLAELTGFPVDYIKRELLLSDDNNLSVEELRKKVLQYLDSNF